MQTCLMDSWHGVAQEAISEALSFKLDKIYKWNVWQSYSQQWKFVQGQVKHLKITNAINIKKKIRYCWLLPLLLRQKQQISCLHCKRQTRLHTHLEGEKKRISSTAVKSKPQSYLCVSTVTFWLTDRHSDLLSNWMTKQMSWDLYKQKIMVWVVRLHTPHTMSHPTRLV